MTPKDIIEQIPPEAAGAMKAAGAGGGLTMAGGIATIFDPTVLTAWGVFMGGLASLLTIFYTIYKNRK